MSSRIRIAVCATFAVVVTSAFPAGAALNAGSAPVATVAAATPDLSTVDGVNAAINSASADQIVAIVTEAFKNFKCNPSANQATCRAWIVSQAAKAQPGMAGKIAAAAAAAGGDTATMIKAAADASGKSTTDIATVVAAANGGDATVLAANADGVKLADLGEPTPTGQTDQGGTQLASNPDAFQPAQPNDTPEPPSTNALQNNGGNLNGNGPNASPT
jgi:hypothetical protein